MTNYFEFFWKVGYRMTNYVRNNDYIFSCVKSLRICKKSKFDGTYVSSFFKINSIII